MTSEITPEDVPADAQPVCGKCKLPAEWHNGSWRHVEPADAGVCKLLFGG